MGVGALTYAYITGRTPNRFVVADRNTRPFVFWFDVASWVLITLVGAGLMAHSYLGWWQ
jgi:hypothetical protein